MDTLRANKNMKNRVYVVAIGLVLNLAATGATHAMSELVTISMQPEWPVTSNPGTVITYEISAVAREGQGKLEVSLSALGLPDGATASFSPSLLRFTGRVPECLTCTLTITCTNVTATDNYPFTITGTGLREAVTITNQVSEVQGSPGSVSPTLALDRVGGGNLALRGKGGSGQTYQVESTPDLRNPTWTAVGSSTADGNGRFTFTTAQAAGAAMRFYRTVRVAAP
jgi:hypothetical protein